VSKENGGRKGILRVYQKEKSTKLTIFKNIHIVENKYWE
jgi:hypothetical protein